jgi:hypothetical protein
MADDDSSGKPPIPTLREIADQTVERWESLYRENPQLYHDTIIEAIKSSIRAEVQGAASDILSGQHRGNITRLMELAIKEWLARGTIVLESPSTELLTTINNILSVLADDAQYAAQSAAVKLKVAAYKLHAAGSTPTQIANKLGVSKGAARGMVQRAAKDIENSKRTLSLYRVKRSKKKRRS